MDAKLPTDTTQNSIWQKASRTNRQIVLGLFGLVVVLTLLHLPLLPDFYNWRISVQGVPFPAGMVLLIDLLDIFYTLGMAGLGVLVISSQHNNRYGWLILIIGLGSAILRLSGHYAFNAYIVYTDGNIENVSLPLAQFAAWLQHWLWVPVVLGLEGVAIPLLFPNGRLPNRWWWLFVIPVVGWLAFGAFVIAFHPFIPIENYFVGTGLQPTNPYASQAVADFVEPVFFTLAPQFLDIAQVMIAIANLSLIVRFIQSKQPERQQIKWFSYIVVMIGLLFIIRSNLSAINTISGIPALIEFIYLLVNSAMPIILGIAIFRYNLWDIDTIINRTLVYTILTAVLITIYFVVIAAIGSIIGTSDDLFLAVLATLVVAGSFQLLRERIQRAINQLMFGQRDDPQAVLMRLANQLNTAIHPKDLLEISVKTIAETLKVPYVAISIRHPADSTTQTEYGVSKTPSRDFSLSYQNELVGTLVVGQRSIDEPFSPVDMITIETVVSQLGAVAYAVRLQSDLQSAREKLVITREEERLRIRRDLHDGLGPSLASLPLKLDAAIDLIAEDQRSSVNLLENIKRQTQQLVTDVRRIVYNLRPPSLDELGLVDALQGAISQLRNHPDGVQIRLEADDLTVRLPAAVEVATYRIIMEAVTNVTRHARAQQCSIEIRVLHQPQRLHITVKDDGIGLPDVVMPNVGLHSMRERAEELGGTFEIKARPMGGTLVDVTLPIIETRNPS